MDNYKPIYQEQNVLQRIIKKVAVWVCVLLAIIYFFGSTPDKKDDVLRVFFIVMIGSYLAFWVAGNLPLLLSSILDGSVRAVGKTPSLINYIFIWWPKSFRGVLLACIAAIFCYCGYKFIQGAWFWFSEVKPNWNPETEIYTIHFEGGLEWTANWTYEQVMSFRDYLWAMLGLMIAFLAVNFVPVQPVKFSKNQNKAEGNSQKRSNEKEEPKQQYSTNDYDESRFNDPYGDWRYSNKKKARSHQAKRDMIDDPSASPNEKKVALNFLIAADEGRLPGIKALPKRERS